MSQDHGDGVGLQVQDRGGHVKGAIGPIFFLQLSIDKLPTYS